jgi:monoterpene epsilon-lactone hydrolase
MPSLESRFLAFTSRLMIRRVADGPTFDVAAFRRSMDARLLLPAFLPRGLRVEPSREPKLPGEWHTPADVAPRRTILHLHGGAFIGGSPRGFRPFAGWLAARSRARVISLDYRLAPEHPFPAALDDAVAAVRALYALGVAPASLGLIGDSAGGALTLGALLALRDAGDPLPAAAALISPLTDLANSGASFLGNAATDSVLSPRHALTLARMYAGDHAVEHPLISPLYADLKGLPSLLIHASDSEMLFDDSRRLAEKARAAGVAVEFTVFREMMHDWHASVPLTPESRHAMKGVGAYFARRVG